jgi:hypothetical protein
MNPWDNSKKEEKNNRCGHLMLTWDLSLESAGTRITLSPRQAMFKDVFAMQNTLFGCTRCILPSQSIQQVAAQLWVTSLPQGSFEHTQCSVTQFIIKPAFGI